MARPGEGYYTQAGLRVPSVTEVLSKFKNPDPLIGWAFKRGYQSGLAAAAGQPAPRSAYAEKEQAAQAGTIAHDMFECWLLNRPYVYDGKQPLPGVMERAQNSFEQAQRWKHSSGLKIHSTEKSLVSERYGFGGTYDAILIEEVQHPGRVEYKHRLGDWKTSNAIYADYLVQVAAYGILAQECQGIKVSGYDILRFSKDDADWEHKYFTDLDDAKEVFLGMLAILPAVNALEERV